MNRATATEASTPSRSVSVTASASARALMAWTTVQTTVQEMESLGASPSGDEAAGGVSFGPEDEAAFEAAFGAAGGALDAVANAVPDAVADAVPDAVAEAAPFGSTCGEGLGGCVDARAWTALTRRTTPGRAMCVGVGKGEGEAPFVDVGAPLGVDEDAAFGVDVGAPLADGEAPFVDECAPLAHEGATLGVDECEGGAPPVHVTEPVPEAVPDHFESMERGHTSPQPAPLRRHAT